MRNEWRSRLRDGAFLQIPGHLLRCEKLNSNQKIVLAYVANLVKKEVAWPSIAKIAERCGLWPSQVQLDICLLKELGILKLVPKEEKHKPSNEYKIDWLEYDKLTGMEPLEALRAGLRDRSIEVKAIEPNGKFIVKSTDETLEFLNKNRALVEEMLGQPAGAEKETSGKT